ASASSQSFGFQSLPPIPKKAAPSPRHCDSSSVVAPPRLIAKPATRHSENETRISEHPTSTRADRSQVSKRTSVRWHSSNSPPARLTDRKVTRSKVAVVARWDD